jgi:2-methylcitrate dehydratase PrpD
MNTASVRIAEFSAAFSPGQLTPELRRACGRAFLDTYAVGLAGRNEAAAQRALRYARFAAGEGTRPTASTARCWGTGEALPLELAALWNGIAAHVLDYDDVTSPLRGHPSVALLPALLALGEAIDADGTALATAYVVGFEVICKLSPRIRGGPLRARLAFHVQHRDRGGRGGVRQAARSRCGAHGERHRSRRVAGGRKPRQFRHRCQIVPGRPLQCRGACVRRCSRAKDSMPRQARSTARSAIWTSMPMARRWMRSWHGSGSGRWSWSAAESKSRSTRSATPRTGRWTASWIFVPSMGLRLDQVASVQVRASAGALTPLIHHRPRTGLEAKFSMEYAVVAALLDGRVDLSSFTDGSVQRPEAQAALERVQSGSADDGAVFPRWSEIEVVLRDGRRFQRRIALLRGSAQAPLTDAELRAKIDDCLAWGKVVADADALFHHAMHLESTTVRALLDGASPLRS